jgi:hypothetical protein
MAKKRAKRKNDPRLAKKRRRVVEKRAKSGVIS